MRRSHLFLLFFLALFAPAAFADMGASAIGMT